VPAILEAPAAKAPDDDALAKVKESLHQLLKDPHVPASVRAQLAPEYQDLEAMLEKLEHGHIHIAVFGRVGVGKSSLLNALLGEDRFFVSPLHGATQRTQTATWRQNSHGHVVLYDTPGINEIDGEQRERLAHDVAARSDLVMFMVDGDVTDTEFAALRLLASENRPLLLVLNKADRYTASERELLLAHLTSAYAASWSRATSWPAPRHQENACMCNATPWAPSSSSSVVRLPTWQHCRSVCGPSSSAKARHSPRLTRAFLQVA
jgi:small GTP-binding protein